MSNPCSPNTSEPQTGLGPILVFDAAKLANFLLEEGMGWLSPLVPQIGGQTFNLTDFCASDPPDQPSTDPTYIANLFNPLNGQAVVEQRDWLFGMVNYFVWYASCQCSSGPQPTPPSPVSQPTTVDFSPPGTDNSAGPTCSTYTYFAGIDHTAAVELRYNNSLSSLAGINPTHVIFTQERTLVSATSGWSTVLTYGYLDSSGTEHVVYSQTVNAANLTTPGTVEFDIPVGTFSLFIHNTVGVGTWSITIGDSVQVWCNGTSPTGSPSSCCPTDPNLLAMIQQVLDQLAFLETLIPVRVPNYAAGTAHSGLSDGGTLSLDSTTIALKVNVDTLPSNYGEVVGTPNTYIDIGWITPSTNEGVQAGIRLSRLTQVVPLPEATSAIDYTFPGGESVTITELQAG